MVNASHNIRPHYEDNAMSKYRNTVYRLLQIYRLVGVLTHDGRQHAPELDVPTRGVPTRSKQPNNISENATPPQSVSSHSSLRRSFFLLSAGHSVQGKIGVTIMWTCIFVQVGLFLFVADNWEHPTPGACDEYTSFYRAKLWYGITNSLLTLLSWTGFAFLSWRNLSKKALCSHLHEPTVLLTLLTLAALFIVDVSKPATSISGISSATYVGAVLMFIVSDAHRVRNRALAIALGVTMTLVTILNFVSEAVCPVKASFFGAASDGDTFSLSKCDLRRSMYLSIFITTVDGMVTSIADCKNERLWFVATRADRATGDASDSSGEIKQHFLRSQMMEGLDQLEAKVLRKTGRRNKKGASKTAEKRSPKAIV
jgi:hypothetical protein